MIASGTNRLEAWARLQTVLRDTVVAITGGPTNRSLLMELVNNEKLRQGPVTTNWLDGYLEQRMAPEDRPGLGVALAAAAVGGHLRRRRGVLMSFLRDAQRGLPQRKHLNDEHKAAEKALKDKLKNPVNPSLPSVCSSRGTGCPYNYQSKG